MIKKYENGYPIPERIMEAARCLRTNPPPRAPEPASRGRGRPRGHANRPRRNEVWDASESPASEAVVVAIFAWFWIGLAATIIALLILWNARGDRLNPHPDP